MVRTQPTRRFRIRGSMAVLAAVLLSGPLSAQFAEPDVEVLQPYGPEQPGDSFGWVGERIGDLNGDGAAEYLIGAPQYPADGTATGKAYVYDGRTGSLVHTVDGSPGDQLGWATAGVGDVDGDGLDDYCVGGPGQFGAPPPNPGRVLVISGGSHTLIHELNGPEGSLFGYDCNRAGDVNGDGRGDVIVGAIAASGAVPFGGSATVFSGADATPIWSYDGTDVAGLAGTAVDSVGDVNGDGTPDQVVGAAQAGPNGTGLAFVLSGVDGSVIHTLEPVSTAGNFGLFFAHGAGDVDADGVGDVYVGDFADSELNTGGRAYVFSGADGSLLWNFGAESVSEGLGMGRGAGDVDDDEHADLLLGAWVNSDAAQQGGKVYLRSGRTGEVLRTFTGTDAFGQIGFDVVALGDVNDDENPDWLLTGNDVSYVVAGIDLRSDDEANDEGDDDRADEIERYRSTGKVAGSTTDEESRSELRAK